MIYNYFNTHQIKSLMLDSGYIKKRKIKKPKTKTNNTNECDLLEVELFYNNFVKRTKQVLFFLSFRFGQERN